MQLAVKLIKENPDRVAINIIGQENIGERFIPVVARVNHRYLQIMSINTFEIGLDKFYMRGKLDKYIEDTSNHVTQHISKTRLLEVLTAFHVAKAAQDEIATDTYDINDILQRRIVAPHRIAINCLAQYHDLWRRNAHGGMLDYEALLDSIDSEILAQGAPADVAVVQQRHASSSGLFDDDGISCDNDDPDYDDPPEEDDEDDEDVW